MKDIELLLDRPCTIGESPTWSAPEEALYWIDVKGPSLCRRDAQGVLRTWTFEADVGAFALLDDALGAVVALRGGLFRLEFPTGATRLLAAPPFDPTLFRLNEGICDARGRFWVGVMFDPLSGDSDGSRQGPMWRFTFAEGLSPSWDISDLRNGFAWGASGDIFCWSHSHTGRVFRAPYDVVTGDVGQAEPFVVVEGDGGVPDGAAMDEEGCYWCAIHGASALHRYDPSGRKIDEVKLPVSQPTMCAFCGSQLDEMIVTSARRILSAEDLRREPHAGGLFRFKPGMRGTPRPFLVR